MFNAEGAPCENDVFEIILSQYGSVLMVLPLGMNSECKRFSTLSAGESVDYATVFFCGTVLISVDSSPRITFNRL
jgi:hypothetical protein